MDFACEVECRAVVRALKLVVPAVSRHAAVPILSYAKLAANGGLLTVEGTDLDRSVSVAVRISERGRGATTINARRLLTVVNALPPDETLSLSIDGTTLHVGTDAGFLSIYGALPAEDFPVICIKKPYHEQHDGILTGDFSTALSRVHPCTSKEETRYYLNGVYLHSVDGSLTLVSTDGHRMAVASDCGDAAFLPDKGIIMPTAAVVAYLRLFGNDDAVAARVIAGKWMEFEADGRKLTTKLIDGAYPQYARVIPKDVKASVSVDRASLDRLLALAEATTSSRRDDGRPVVLSIQHGRLAVDADDPDTGSMIAPLPIHRIDGEFPEIAFNRSYLRDLISAAGGDDFTICVSSARDPARIDADGLTLVLMPMIAHGARPLPVRQLEAAE